MAKYFYNITKSLLTNNLIKLCSRYLCELFYLSSYCHLLRDFELVRYEIALHANRLALPLSKIC